MSQTNIAAKRFIPDNVVPAEAYARCSHLGIGAHQDDLEFMAFHGISSCYGQDALWFGGVTCSDGGGSARTGRYADYTDEAMKAVRVEEQEKAAALGEYSFVEQLGFTSASIKDPASRTALVDKLETILLTTQPEVLYTHNPADRHATHIGVFLACLEAVRRIPPYSRPKKIYGCEVWRDLDWLDPVDKVALDVSGHPELAEQLHACFDSQIAGGKNYGKAVIGRWTANATFLDSHSVDAVNRLTYAIDLTPLAEDDELDLHEFVASKLDRFREDVLKYFETPDENAGDTN
ncbi:PIG-L deacetylase family protein [Coraliomargarita parva]|uniref:PIG-L deacetylase family protein n=1 Tax=Coraliomargarita parva TaxID=3014050 RepID=UPI0022B3945F|nr:PIG-L family deacetylase [Coraliomargarita parva]